MPSHDDAACGCDARERGMPMAKYTDREAFIPFTRRDVLELCLEDGRLSPEQAGEFRRFAEILAAYKHFEYQQSIEKLKESFVLFNPDANTRPVRQYGPDDTERLKNDLVTAFERVLRNANYTPVTRAELEEAFMLDALIKLRTKVDFADFDLMLIYARGRTKQTVELPRLIGTKKTEIDNFDRVVAVLKFKEENHFRQKKRKLADLQFQPGKVYVYLYKNIPKYDLETVFPNLETRMMLRDRLLFGVPAAAAVGSVIVRSVSRLALIVGMALILLFGAEVAKTKFNINEELTTMDFVKFWAAMSSLMLGLGAVAFRQWSSYRTKKLRFQKIITETLFFKNIATNSSVFHAVSDAAEEEECKEMILVYYHLLTSAQPLTADELDDAIEAWFDQKMGVKVDFDIDHTIECLRQVHARLPEPSRAGALEETALLRCDSSGVCQALPLREANRLIDFLWDDFFSYSNAVTA